MDGRNDAEYMQDDVMAGFEVCGNLEAWPPSSCNAICLAHTAPVASRQQ